MQERKWSTYILKDIVTKLGDGLHGTPVYTDDGEYFFINGNNLSNGKIIIKNDTKSVDEKEYNKYKKELNDRTILVSINGTLGNIAYYNNEKVVLGKSACYFNVKESFSKDFVRYVMTTAMFKAYLDNYATGATIKNVSLKAMRNFKFSAPDEELRQKIASVLLAYDDLIDKNNRKVELLQNMAEELYKEWFVRRSNPQWETVKLKDFGYEIESGSRPKGGIDDSLTEGYPSLGAEAIDKLGIFDFSNVKLIPKEFYNKLNRGKNKNKDILLYKDGAYIGKVTLFMDDFPFKEYAINEHVFFIRAKMFKYQYFLYFTLNQPQYFTQMQNLNRNAAQPGLTPRDIDIVKILKPDENTIDKFNEIIEPILHNIFAIAKSNYLLNQQRDLLLPRLMSGKLEIKER